MKFDMNGYVWQVKIVQANSNDLCRSDGTITVGVTDSSQLTIYLSNRLRGAFLRKVMLHEFTHALMFSYDYRLTLQEEEFVCDFLASNTDEVIFKVDEILNYEMSKVV